MTGLTTSDTDPNFAVILEFLHRFGKDIFGESWKLRISPLEEGLESCSGPPSPFLVDLIVKLLRKVHKSISADRWEKSLIRYLSGREEDAKAEMLDSGFASLSPEVKIRILRSLCESQFEFNVKFKNSLSHKKDLRSSPLGQDKRGDLYWYFEDEEGTLRIYKEDLDEETWELVAKDKASFILLLDKLKNNGLSTKEPSPSTLDDEASLQDGLENIILDTRPVPNSIEHSNATSVANSDLEEDTSPLNPSSPSEDKSTDRNTSNKVVMRN
ncbi:RSF1 [Lepeophtheirus salmonis]|uniref:RSF1 n=1 Tax=Lepeophtheirus salmonis TaxID=72036 RepID=A0A7R8CT54_LEPSM|nr:RSF1 [Lepeophtheirus salmonis]CAF2922532.1 RSF1 [Lepeophtheirus salmonis]